MAVRGIRLFKFVFIIKEGNRNVKYLALAAILLFITLSCVAQEVKTIKLKPQKNLYIPNSYYISNVVDDRDDTTNIGTMRAGIAGKTTAINLQNGSAAAINEFINKSITQDAAKDPVELHIIQLQVSEKDAGMRQQADIAFGVAFYEGGEKLIEYTGSAYTQTGLDASAYIGTMIKQNVERSMREFDTWFTTNHSNTKAEVQTEVTVERTADDPQYIVYSNARKVRIEDFQAVPDDMSKGIAATFSGISMKYSHERKGRSIILKVFLIPYFDKDKSWCKPEGRNARTMNHEQRHFDITAYKACELAETIKNYPFTVENYTDQLQNLLKQTDKEATEMQHQYDGESVHGTKLQQQAAWDIRVKRLLTDKNCY